MLKKYVTIFVTILILNLSLSTLVFAGTKDEKSAAKTEEVKLNIAKLGTGKDTKINVKLKDGTKLKGYISEVNENNFVVTNHKSGVSTEVPYANAKQVKGNNLSTGAKVAIGVGIAVAVIAIVVLIALPRDIGTPFKNGIQLPPIP